MVRKYVRKRPRQWKDKDKRMAAAVRLRAEGKSLREIAKELAVTHPTVLADLRRWDELHPNVVSLPVNRPGKSCPPRGEIYQSDLPPVEPPTPIRRVKLWRSSPFARSGTAR